MGVSSVHTCLPDGDTQELKYAEVLYTNKW